MADTRADQAPLDQPGDVPGQRGVQAMWREQNAAFRARVLQRRLSREDARPRPA